MLIGLVAAIVAAKRRKETEMVVKEASVALSDWVESGVLQPETKQAFLKRIGATSIVTPEASAELNARSLLDPSDPTLNSHPTLRRKLSAGAITESECRTILEVHRRESRTALEDAHPEWDGEFDSIMGVSDGRTRTDENGNVMELCTVCNGDVALAAISETAETGDVAAFGKALLNPVAGVARVSLADAATYLAALQADQPDGVAKAHYTFGQVQRAVDAGNSAITTVNAAVDSNDAAALSKALDSPLLVITGTSTDSFLDNSANDYLGAMRRAAAGGGGAGVIKSCLSQPDIQRIIDGCNRSAELRLASAAEHPLEVLVVHMARSRLRVLDLFNFFDRSRKGSLSEADFAEGMKRLKLPLSDGGASALFKSIDKSGRGTATFADLSAAIGSATDLRKKHGRHVNDRAPLPVIRGSGGGWEAAELKRRARRQSTSDPAATGSKSQPDIVKPAMSVETVSVKVSPIYDTASTPTAGVHVPSVGMAASPVYDNIILPTPVSSPSLRHVDDEDPSGSSTVSHALDASTKLSYATKTMTSLAWSDPKPEIIDRNGKDGSRHETGPVQLGKTRRSGIRNEGRVQPVAGISTPRASAITVKQNKSNDAVKSMKAAARRLEVAKAKALLQLLPPTVSTIDAGTATDDNGEGGKRNSLSS